MNTDRRNFIRTIGIAAVAATALPLRADDQNKNIDIKIVPGEALMRQHGVLDRLLLIYDETRRRLGAHTDFSADSLNAAAKIVQDFIENYHEKLEENYLFPRFQNSRKHADLVTTLKEQHDAGRALTTRVFAQTLGPLKSDDDRLQLASTLERFVTLFRPHQAREDTVLFPAFHQLISESEYASLGDQFKKEERQHFGQDGFDAIVQKVADIEKDLGIHDLTQFTPRSV